MRVLVAEDDSVSRALVSAALRRMGHTVIAVENGAAALEELEMNPSIPLAIFDRMMPALDGVELCREVRRRCGDLPYIILLTAMSEKIDVEAGLDAGADDYMTKPFDNGELRARVGVGERTVMLKTQLRERVQALEEALAHVKQLQGLLPICMHCKRIRDDQKTWHDIDRYMAEHTEATFSHGVCQSCFDKFYGNE